MQIAKMFFFNFSNPQVKICKVCHLIKYNKYLLGKYGLRNDNTNQIYYHTIPTQS